MVSQKCDLQHIIVLSTTKAEYIALIEAKKEVLQLKGISTKLKLSDSILVVCSDSQSIIHLSKNSAFHERIKHINIMLHSIRDIASSGQVKVEKIESNINPTNVLTKTMPVSKVR